MDATIFRAALRASAKVALGATISSCGGSVHTAAEGEAPDALADASVEASRGDETALADAPIADATAVQDGQAGATCNPPAAASLIPEQDHSGIRIDDTLFDCCASTIGSDFFLDGAPHVTLDAAASDPHIMGCCAVVVYRLNADLGGDGAAISSDDGTLQKAGLTGIWSDVITSCCIPLHDYYGVCTPWGPPMPPAMPEVA